MELVSPLRLCLSLTVVAFVVVVARALWGHPRVLRVLGVWASVGLVVGAFVSHVLVPRGGPPYLFGGVFVGTGLALASLGWAPARAAFDALDDGQVRSLLSFRATFGAFLFAAAAVGLFPSSFALGAGVGDLVVGWLALVAPASLGARGSRAWRLLVHGVGLFDLLQVVFLALTVVRPWLEAHQSIGPSLPLPWVGVPLMFAINLHGLRTTLAEARERTPHASDAAGSPARSPGTRRESP